MDKTAPTPAGDPVDHAAGPAHQSAPADSAESAEPAPEEPGDGDGASDGWVPV
jgi:hypothetical protein